MASLEELRSIRIEKLNELRKRGINPFPSRTQRTHLINEVLGSFENLSESKEAITVSGRIRGLRSHGGSLFLDIEDTSGTIQVFCDKATLGEETYDTVSTLFDLGDIIEVSGSAFRTKQAVMTIHSSNVRMLAKAIRPLPDTHFGLKDKEERLRRRFLDLAVNAETRELFKRKAVFWKSARYFLEERGFIEVDTPALQDVAGGADATPFTTHHNALDKDFYLRISLEIPLKKIIIGSFEKVYEIGKVFRNEGISSEHLQDYIECEFYWAYADYSDMMAFVESMFRHIATETTGSLNTSYDGKKIDWAGEWEKADFIELLEKHLSIKLSELNTDDKLREYAESLGLSTESAWGWGRILDHIWKKKVRPNIVGPMFLVNHPVEVSPLAKSSENNPDVVERLQVIAGGMEVGNGWSELNDPEEQKRRFDAQQMLRDKGDEEAQMKDESFIEALEYGMPPTAGFGFSERLFALLMDRPVRETVIFPPMREEND